MNNIKYRQIEMGELKFGLFEGFNRYQEVKKCWRKEEGNWVLKDISFVEEWGEEDYNQLLLVLGKTLESDGELIGAFKKGQLVGFVSVEKNKLGSKKQYIQLSELYVSTEERSLGIGRELFNRAIQIAKGLKGQKLYISAHSSEESQKFYRTMGCVEAEEYDRRLSELEPCDCQMEYLI